MKPATGIYGLAARKGERGCGNEARIVSQVEEEEVCVEGRLLSHTVESGTDQGRSGENRLSVAKKPCLTRVHVAAGGDPRVPIPKT